MRECILFWSYGPIQIQINSDVNESLFVNFQIYTNVRFDLVAGIFQALSSQFECLPNGEPIPGVPRYLPSFSLDKHHSLDRFRSRSPSFGTTRPAPLPEFCRIIRFTVT
ncbi:uncharacterized protein LOC117177075 isoform X2 [Belonocnema kinseyi]|uniref:uncharacterized protein LOC117177075 isoform X2 n=1 Tax=Belonocnema kinseyi TaxID=2817044 RepID=UPI00143DC657|nr:uncharacterized protein LOC117177075 isoform X2 [Belonocnema kinseyi]